MKSKRHLVSLLAIGAVSTLALSACATGAVGPDTVSDEYKIAFIQGVAGDEFYITMQCGIEAEASKEGVTVNTQGPAKFDPTLQKPIVDSVAASKPDAILVAPTDVTAMQAPLKAAAAAGIKIVLVDTTVEDPSFAVSRISSDNEGGGAAAFTAIQELHPDGGKVLVISTDPGVSTVDARIKGFEEAAAKDAAFEYVGVQYSHNDPAQAAKLVTAALAKDPDIVGVFGTNMFAAEGTSTGVRQAGKGGELSIVGFDAGPAQVQQLKDGVVQALVAQEPGTIGTQAVQQAIASLKGTDTEEQIQTGFTIITADNLEGEGADFVYKSNC